MFACVTTFAVHGLDSRRVTVEVDIRDGLETFTIVGLPDRAVREARERVRAALKNSGFEFPKRRITVNLAPADVRKAGPAFDLAIAMGVLTASDQVPAEATRDYGLCAELSLTGRVRGIRGALAIAIGARQQGVPRLLLAPDNAREAALIEEVEALPVSDLGEIVALFQGTYDPGRAEPADPI